jgi:T5SS/PEP-CTERM-associated repeat protein/autotransporter-associated beta strand protein
LTLTATSSYSGNTTVNGGTLNMTGGGQVTDSGGFIASTPGSAGTVTVNGTGSAWTNTGSLFIGGNTTGPGVVPVF